MPRYRESGGKAPGILYLDTVRRRYVPVLYTQWKIFELNFDVLLTVHLSIILVTDHLNAQILIL